MVKEIPLQNGMVALVDDEDYERVSKYVWHYYKSSDTVFRVMRNGENGERIDLKREILQIHANIIIHKDKNSLNHQKENLKVTNQKTANIRARGKRNGSSKYKGVHWYKSRRKFVAAISPNGKQIRLGYFDNEDEAAKAYNDAALKHFGEDAFLNVIGEDCSAINVPDSKQKQIRKSNKSSNCKGVFKRGSKFYAYISYGGKTFHIGSFNDLEIAAKAYDQKAYELYGDKAILNFSELKGEYEQALKEVKPTNIKPINIKPIPVELVSEAIKKTVAARQK